MRISGFHLEVAKLVADGLRPQDIRRKLRISSSRISILKANPVFQQHVQRIKHENRMAYKQAVEVFSGEAAAMARTIVDVAKNPLVGSGTRIHAATVALEKLQEHEEAESGPRSTEHLTFEAMLRVTKTTTPLSAGSRGYIPDDAVDEPDTLDEPLEADFDVVEEPEVDEDDNSTVDDTSDSPDTLFTLSPEIAALLGKTNAPA